MSLRHVLISAVVTCTLVSIATPATAEEGIGAAAYTGSVVAATGTVPPALAIEIVAQCGHLGYTTLSGQVQFVFGGVATSYSTVPTSAEPLSTQVTCTLISPQQAGVPGSPGTLTWTTRIVSPGVTAATTSVTPPWPQRPVVICVSGEAHYGQVPASRALDQVCSEATLLPAGATACADGSDNDGDGRTDYPADPDCTGPQDLSENEDPGTGTCAVNAAGVVACLDPGEPVAEYAVHEPVVTTPNSGSQVAGHIDVYAFSAGGTTAVLPCVELVVGNASAGCAAAGGRFLYRQQTLVETTAGVPQVQQGEHVATVRVCTAALTVTVLGFGISSAPAYTVC